MRNTAFPILLLAAGLAVSACRNVPADTTGPAIGAIETSGNVLVISDCSGTSLTISTKVTDPSGVGKVQLWYRTGTDGQFLSTAMEGKQDTYSVDLKGPDFLGRPYGTLEFYITAEDELGNLSRSAVDQSVQFLPCVNH
jgi:hypothetical protein